MRASFSAFALLLAACAPPAPSATVPDIAVQDVAAGSWRATLDAAGGYAATSYGPSERNDLFRVFCSLPVGRVTLQSAHTLPHDQETTMTIHTAARAIALPARSENLPDGALVFAQLDGVDPRLTALSQAQQRFTIEVEGVSLVIPWHDSIAQTLRACG